MEEQNQQNTPLNENPSEQPQVPPQISEEPIVQQTPTSDGKNTTTTLLVSIIVLLLLVIVGGVWYFNENQRSDTSFTGCTEEVILCPDGKTGVGRVPPTCEFAECPVVKDERNNNVSSNNSCVVDSDCVLIDTSLDYSQCWAGACGRPDYSREEYISVNRESWQKKYPPSTFESCGPAPACPTFIGDSKAVCSEKVCIKVLR